jgi:hypothetical protein
MENSVLKEALRYRERGISIVPMTTYFDDQGEVKKKPLVAWTEFQSRLASADEIKKWWSKDPRALIGAVTGNFSNICVADADKPEALTRLSEFLTTSKVPTSKTPRPGNHFFFRPPKNCPGGTSTAIGLDFRGQNSLVILPPSVNCQGKPYSWLPGLSIDEIEPPPLPQAYIEFIRSNSFGSKAAGFQGQMFQDGNRDNSLFHTALCLLKGGMPREEVYQVLEIAIMGWGETPGLKWIWDKIESAEKRVQSRDRNFTQEVRDLISMMSGQFRIGQVFRDIPNIGAKDRAKIRVVLRRLVVDKTIERVGKEDGVFRRIEKEEEVLDVRRSEGGEFLVKMPFKEEEHVKIFPKSIIVVAAPPDGGKTAYLLNVALMNRDAHGITYVTSEMGVEEFADRIDKMEIDRDEWFQKVKVISKSSDFSDSIRPDGLNIIDYVDLGVDDFPRVGEIIRRIWDRLETGVAFIGLQKNFNTDLPQGGIGSIKLARLAISLEHGKMKIIKAKGWRDTKINPCGFAMEFKLVSGWKFLPEGVWIRKPEAVRVPALYRETAYQYKQSKKRMGKTKIATEFEKRMEREA